MINAQALVPVTGTIRNVTQIPGDCCTQVISVSTQKGPVNFIVTPDTAVIDNVRLRPNMQITAFYDSTLPVPLIFPPQYRAELVTSMRRDETAALNFFNRNLTAADNSLRLNPDRSTDISTLNGQRYTCQIGGNFLLVFYSVTTRSIPPQTTPRKIVVLCRPS